MKYLLLTISCEQTLISGLEKYSVPKLMSIVGQTDAALAGLITSIDQVGAPLQSALVAA